MEDIDLYWGDMIVWMGVREEEAIGEGEETALIDSLEKAFESDAAIVRGRFSDL